MAAAIPGKVIREGKVPAAYFLEQAGAKDMSRGEIHVAAYHANLIYNAGGGTAADLCALIAELKARVRRQFGVELQEEVQYVGFPWPTLLACRGELQFAGGTPVPLRASLRSPKSGFWRTRAGVDACPTAARGAALAVVLLCAALAHAADLHEAVTSGDVEQVRALLAAGADSNTRDALGATPLHDAAWTGNREIAALLIAHRADVNAHHLEAGSTPLHYAVIKDNREVAELLLTHGAAVDAVDRWELRRCCWPPRAAIRTWRFCWSLTAPT